MLVMLVITCLVFLLLLEVEFLIIAFKSSIFWGILCLLFFPLNLVFLVTHWRNARNNFFKTLLVFAVLLCTESYMITGSAIPRLHNFTFGFLNVRQVVSQSKFYDQAHLTLTGKISNYREAVSPRGNAYTTFRLNDGTGSLTVHARKKLGGVDGQYVRVKGVFKRVTRVGKRKVYNQLEANRVLKGFKKKKVRRFSDYFKNLLKKRVDTSDYFIPPEDKLVNVTAEDKAFDNSGLLTVHKNKLKKIQVSGFGKVYKILPDDLKGDKHQRFLLQITPELTILIAHNIDLAPRVSSLKIGDLVRFSGQYEWNEEGGVVHWTHRDPSKKHRAGWLELNRKIYQ